jgi:hypothetical protein
MRGIIDKDVDLAEFPDRLLDDLPAMVRLPHIAGNRQALAIFAFDQPAGVFGVAMFVEI